MKSVSKPFANKGANIELAGLETALVNVMSRETILRQYLDSVKGQYDFAIVDCMPLSEKAAETKAEGKSLIRKSVYSILRHKQRERQPPKAQDTGH